MAKAPQRATGAEKDQLTATFAALADPTRRAILTSLAEGGATVNELAKPLPMSLQAVSKHLKVLERAGLIQRGRHAQRRPCRLVTTPLDHAAGWIGQHCRPPNNDTAPVPHTSDKEPP